MKPNQVAVDHLIRPQQLAWLDRPVHVSHGLAQLLHEGEPPIDVLPTGYERRVKVDLVRAENLTRLDIFFEE